MTERSDLSDLISGLKNLMSDVDKTIRTLEEEEDTKKRSDHDLSTSILNNQLRRTLSAVNSAAEMVGIESNATPLTAHEILEKVVAQALATGTLRERKVHEGFVNALREMFGLDEDEGLAEILSVANGLKRRKEATLPILERWTLTLHNALMDTWREQREEARVASGIAPGFEPNMNYVSAEQSRSDSLRSVEWIRKYRLGHSDYPYEDVVSEIYTEARAKALAETKNEKEEVMAALRRKLGFNSHATLEDCLRAIGAVWDLADREPVAVKKRAPKKQAPKKRKKTRR